MSARSRVQQAFLFCTVFEHPFQKSIIFIKTKELQLLY